MVKNIFVMAFLAVIFFSAQAFAEAPIYTGPSNNVGVSGYDTVSYFSETGPVKGSKHYATEWRGASWYFSSQDNLDKFKADPEKYAPQYGGYCAWAVGHGGLSKGNPKQWTIADGKLYLNYDSRILASWLPVKDELIPVADKEYPNLVDFEGAE